MSAAAEAGDVAVREVIVRAAVYLGIGIANMVNAIHPDLVVLGGGVACIGPLLLDTVRATVRAGCVCSRSTASASNDPFWPTRQVCTAELRWRCEREN